MLTGRVARKDVSASGLSIAQEASDNFRKAVQQLDPTDPNGGPWSEVGSQGRPDIEVNPMSNSLKPP
jgi:hypothetical protein